MLPERPRPYQSLGQLVRQTREQRGLTQAHVAQRVGVSPSHLCHLEAGRHRASPPVLRRLARVLGLHPLTLLIQARQIHPLLDAYLRDYPEVQPVFIELIDRAHQRGFTVGNWYLLLERLPYWGEGPHRHI